MSASWTQKSRSKDQECVAVSSICENCHKALQTWLQKKERKKEKKRKGKDDRTLLRSDLISLPLDLLWSQMDKRRNGNHEGFVDTSYHPLHKFTMPRVVVKFTWQSLGELCTALMAHAGRLNSLLEPSWPNVEQVQVEMYNLVDTLFIHGVDQKWFSTFALVEGVEVMVTTPEIHAVSSSSLFCVSAVPFLTKFLFHQCHRQRGMQLLAAFAWLIRNMSQTCLTDSGLLRSAIACLQGGTW